MVEAFLVAHEHERHLDHFAFGRPLDDGTFLFLQRVFDDLFQSGDIDEVKAQGASAGRIHGRLPVLFAQPHQLLGFPNFAPGVAPAQQVLGVFADILTLFPGATDDVVGVAHGVGRYFRWVIVFVVGAATAFGNARMGFNQFSIDVDANQLAVTAHVRFFAAKLEVHRIESLLETYMAVRMDGRRCPIRGIETFLCERLQSLLLPGLKLHERLLLSRSVSTHPRDVQAPAYCLPLAMFKIQEIFTLEEIVADVRHLALHMGLVFRRFPIGRINFESPILSILIEGSIECWMVLIGLDDSGLQIVEDD